MARITRGVAARASVAVRAALVPFAVWLAIALPSAARAQTVTNPRMVEFAPSSDHNTVLPDGRAAVTNYAFQVYMQGATSPFQVTNIGKPAPQVDGLVRYDFSSQVASWPVTGGVYESRVAAVGPNGTTLSGLSNAFTFSTTATCTFSVSPTSVSMTSGGGSWAIAVSTASGCAWTASSGATWIGVSPTSGSGNGTVTVTAGANTATASRTGTVTIAGQAVTVTQAPAACTFALSPSAVSAGSSGGTSTITLTTTSACSWKATPNASWIGVSPTSGSGGGSLSVTVAANTSTSSRTGSLTIGDNTLPVTQAGVACSFSVSPASATVAAGGGTVSLGVTTQSPCSWTASSSATWASLSPTSGAGNGTVTVTVAANTSTTSRTTTLSLGGQPATITQDAAPSTSVFTGDGLRGEYYENPDLTAPVTTRVDRTIDFAWGNGAPAASMGVNTFSARWTGRVKAQSSGSYTFYTVSDDGVRLWVNGQLLVDNWTVHKSTENSGTVALVAGQAYDVRLEYFDKKGDAVVRLLWSSASTPKAVVPQIALSSTSSAAASASGLAADIGTATQSATAMSPGASSTSVDGAPGDGSGDGLLGEYFDNWDFTAPVSTRLDRGVDFTWDADAPQPGMGADTFSVRWTGRVQAQFSEPYTFHTLSDDGVRLWIDGQLIVDHWTNHPGTEASGTIALTAGQWYDVRLEYFENGGEAVARLLWSSPSTAKAVIPPAALSSSSETPAAGATAAAAATGVGTLAAGTGEGLRADYYDDWDFTVPLGTRVDPVVDFAWGTGAPLPAMSADAFSVRWTGRVEAPTSEVYTFYTVSDDGVRLWVNDQLLVDNWTNHATTENSGSVALLAGQTYTIRLEYFENDGDAVARLLWSSASTPKQVIPRTQLLPAP